MDNRLLTKLALLDALVGEKRENPYKEAFHALLDNLTQEQRAILSGYCRYQRRKHLCRELTACRYMIFRDPLLRNVSLSTDPIVRKKEANALIQVKKLRVGKKI